MNNNQQSTFHISCAIDNSFVFPLSVMLVSLLENHKNFLIKIHLFSASLSENYVVQFQDLITKKYRQQFSFYKLNSQDFKGFRINSRISYAAYYRILMPGIIDAEVDRFLYLDADIIINNRLDALFDTQMGDKFFGAINDVVAIDWNMHSKHHIPDAYLYFNSGVLLIDRQKWLDFDATQKVIRYLNEYRDICDYHDQDGLNGALYENRYNLSPIWNQQIGLFFIEPSLLKLVFGENYAIAIEKPVIIHYNGIEKPWNYVSEHPWRHQFERYAKVVTGFGTVDKPTLKKWVKRNLLYKIIGWKRVSKYFYYITRPVNKIELPKN